MSGWWIPVILGVGWVGFSYVGYPLVLSLLARVSPRPIRGDEAFPPLSVIIAVHNGEGALAAKLESTLSLEYPETFEILVASDGSTDDTDAIALSFAERGVKLVRTEERGGKESAQAAAIAKASGDVLVFTDVTAELEPDALCAIVRPFSDPEVGCVSSEDVVDSEGGEGVYVRFEMALRRLESQVGSLVGLSGSFFAVRRELATPWPHDLASDFRSALESARRGYRAVSEPRAGARFVAPDDPALEWPRKVRTVRRGLAVLSSYTDLLSPTHGRVALSLWGHKVSRFTSPFALAAILVGSLLGAADSGLLALLVVGQVVFYAAGLTALKWPATAPKPARLAGFFLLVNASMAVAWRYHITGQRAVVWQPTRRG